MVNLVDEVLRGSLFERPAGFAAADVAVAVTGVAGPGGGSSDKPVGLVWFGVATRSTVQTLHHVFPGDRMTVRAATVTRALGLISDATTGP